jgi:hypothetical protein
VPPSPELCLVPPPRRFRRSGPRRRLASAALRKRTNGDGRNGPKLPPALQEHLRERWVPAASNRIYGPLAAAIFVEPAFLPIRSRRSATCRSSTRRDTAQNSRENTQ